MILQALNHGKTQARRKVDLAVDLGWYTDKGKPNTRAVEAAIQQARLDGEPICSDETGYWLGSAEEVRACAERLRRRAGNQLVTARALRRSARRLEGVAQVELGLVA